MVSRRSFLAGGCACCFPAAWRPASAQQGAEGPRRSCLPGEAETGAIAVAYARNPAIVDFRGTDDREFNQALATALVEVSDVLEALPAFGFMRERDFPVKGDFGARNAIAMPRVFRRDRPDGTVLFGLGLLEHAQAERSVHGGHWHLSVLATCAHEFAHIRQFKHRVTERLIGADGRTKRAELHADFLAGYFAGARKRRNPNFQERSFLIDAERSGDWNVGGLDHHGTPRERMEATRRGFEAAYRSGLSVGEATLAGMQYAAGLPG